MSGRGLALGPGDQYLQEVNTQSANVIIYANMITCIFGVLQDRTVS